MNYCPRCGSETGESDIFCKRCGTRLESPEMPRASKSESEFVKKTCPVCGGRGRIKSRSLLKQNEPCPVCGGAGKNKFEVSQGEEVMQCGNCNGKGVVGTMSLNEPYKPCEVCGGKGWLVK